MFYNIYLYIYFILKLFHNIEFKRNINLLLIASIKKLYLKYKTKKINVQCINVKLLVRLTNKKL